MNWSSKEAKVSLHCNTLLLRQLRERRGWSQAQLAKAAGYSLRLISKLESGGTVTRQTIEDVADALSTSNHAISVEDLTSDPVGIAKRYFEILYGHHPDPFSLAVPFFHEDVEFRLPGDPALIPFAGVFRGHTEVAKLFKIFFTVMEAPIGHDHRPWYSYSVSANDVMVWGKSWFHPIGQPLKEPMTISNLMKFQDGKLILLEDNFDTLKAAELFEAVQ